MIIAVRHILLAVTVAAISIGFADARQPERAASHRGIGNELPPNWSAEPPDSEGHGISFVSPDGSAWIVLSKELASGNVAAHMESVASIAGERVTYLRRARSWIVVSGFKGDRIFYRKAMLACANKVWHQIAFEYPASEKLKFDRLVTRISRALEAHKHEGCKAK